MTRYIGTYIHALVDYTRCTDIFQYGLSPRAGLALIRSAKTWAWMEGVSYVLPVHVQSVLAAVVGHRLRFKDDGMNPSRAGHTLIENVAIP